MMQVIRKHQTLFDFTCQHCGSMEAVFVFAMLNGIGITDEVPPGTQLETVVVDNKVVADYVKSKLVIATAFAMPFIPSGGIGFMRIMPGSSQENNRNNGFKVS